MDANPQLERVVKCIRQHTFNYFLNHMTPYLKFTITYKSQLAIISNPENLGIINCSVKNYKDSQLFWKSFHFATSWEVDSGEDSETE